MLKTKLKKWARELFVGEITIRKADLWFAGAFCMLAGMVHGLLTAPLTHGITIGSNNKGVVKGDGNINKSCGEEEE